MTDQLNTRAHDILASYGGDARRWPDAERDGVTAAIAADAGLRAAHRDARALDGLLDEWVGRDLAGGSDARDAAARVLRRSPAWRRWIGGGVAAAAVAVLAAALPHAPEHKAMPAAAAVALTDEAAFASLFNPTPDEETLL